MEGGVEIVWRSGAWIVLKEDNTQLTVSGAQTVKNIVQTATDYAASAGWPLYPKSSRARPFIFEDNESWLFPTANGNVVWGPGIHAYFNNATKPALSVGTQAYGSLLLPGAQIRLTGSGPVVLLQPINSYESGGVTTNWTRQHRFDFGTVEAVGGNPSDLILVDVTQAAGASFVCSNIKFAGEGWGRATYGLRFLSPVLASQIAAENTWDMTHMEGFRLAGIKQGESGQYDNNLGAQIFLGNVGAGYPEDLNCIIDSNAPWCQYYFQSANFNSPGGQYNFRFRANAGSNLVICEQVIPGSIGSTLDQNATGKPNKFDINLVPTPPPAGTFQGTTGSPTQLHAAAGPWLYVEREPLQNGRKIIKLWDRCDVSGAIPSKVLKRNSAGNYDVVLDVTNNHPGGDVLSPVTVDFDLPATGTFYRGSYFTTSQPRSMVDPKLRATSNQNLSGNGVTLTEDGGVTGQPIPFFGVTYAQ